ncbi:MAG: hypothetical protein JNL58_31645 [Planctomyces sp.]|nr:hypothetical protein [Planctomyces sp.]
MSLIQWILSRQSVSKVGIISVLLGLLSHQAIMIWDIHALRSFEENLFGEQAIAPITESKRFAIAVIVALIASWWLILFTLIKIAQTVSIIRTPPLLQSRSHTEKGDLRSGFASSNGENSKSDYEQGRE